MKAWIAFAIGIVAGGLAATALSAWKPVSLADAANIASLAVGVLAGVVVPFGLSRFAERQARRHGPLNDAVGLVIAPIREVYDTLLESAERPLSYTQCHDLLALMRLARRRVDELAPLLEGNGSKATRDRAVSAIDALDEAFSMNEFPMHDFSLSEERRTAVQNSFGTALSVLSDIRVEG